MKKLYLCTLTALLIGLCSGCTESFQEEIASTSDSKTFNVREQGFRVVNVLLTTGKQGYGSSTVAYLLLENDEVVVFGHAHAPLSREQARAIMKFQMGDTVMVKSRK